MPICICMCFRLLQKGAKTSPRWQHSDMYTKEQQHNSKFDSNSIGDRHTLTNNVNNGDNMAEDERDPDVIPAQYGTFGCLSDHTIVLVQ